MDADPEYGSSGSPVVGTIIFFLPGALWFYWQGLARSGLGSPAKNLAGTIPVQREAYEQNSARN